jgi:pyrroloquinoline-quinone synthase
VRAFNSVLTASCVLDELEVGVGCMGIIEYAFAGISAAIGSAVVRRGWVPADSLVHYKLHAEIDERHAEEFFAVVEPHWDDPRRRYLTRQGLELGAHVFDRLYRDLLATARVARPDQEHHP